MQFVYEEFNNISDIENDYGLLNIKLLDVQSKHFVFPEKNKYLSELSNRVNYNFSVFGSNHNAVISEEKNRIINMSKSSCERPVRFVIDNFNRIWADNTHWCIAYILKYGNDTTIGDVPMYIIDLRNHVPKIININNTVYDSLNHIKNAIICAKEIQNRIDQGWRNIEVSYCIKDLISELGL